MTIYANTSGKSEDPPPNVRIRGSSFFRYWCSYFPFFLCFRCLYILRDVRISLLLQRAGRKLQHIVALPSSLPPPLHLWKCFSRCFPTVFSSISRSCFALYFDVLVDSGWIELKRIVGYAVMILIEEQMRKAVNLLLKTPNCVVLSMKLL